jgi:hypothetical protein
MKKLIGGAAFLAGLAGLVIAATAQATFGEGVTSTAVDADDNLRARSGGGIRRRSLVLHMSHPSSRRCA